MNRFSQQPDVDYPLDSGQVFSWKREGPVLFFDGDCVLCSFWVEVVLRFDRARKLRLATLSSPPGLAVVAELEKSGIREDSLVFYENGRLVQGPEAVWEVLRFFPLWLRWLRVFRFLPGFLQTAVYRWVARNRYRIFGKKEQCYVPGPGDRGRFLR